MVNDIAARFRLARPGFALDAWLDFPGDRTVALFGPSGAGKSSFLRLMAGLDRPDEGFLSVAGEVWLDTARGVALPAHRRRIGYVFQEGALFPHLTVAGNLAYAAGRARERPPIPFDDLVSLLSLGGLLDRRTERLSGGERQRVALGRALLTAPQLLLLDEPLASLDADARREILPVIASVGREGKVPTLYVTHALPEATHLADTLALMEGGTITATGPVAAMTVDLDRPLAFGDDAGAAFDCVVEGEDETDRLTTLSFPGGRLFAPRRGLPAGGRVRVRVVASDVALSLEEPGRTSMLNILPGVVAGVAPRGEAQVMVTVDVGETRLLARITKRSAGRLSLAPGVRVHAMVKSVALVV